MLFHYRMNADFSYVPLLLSIGLVWMASLSGVFGVFLGVERLNRVISHLVSFAVGALLGGAFLHLIPHAFEHDAIGQDTPLYIVGGIFVFFILERFLHWHHEHHVEQGSTPVQPVVTMNIVGGAMHNLVDGLLIGAAYGVGVDAGVVATTAILLHQLPQELGEFGVLVHGGLSPSRAILFNFASGSAVVIGGPRFRLRLGVLPTTIIRS